MAERRFCSFKPCQKEEGLFSERKQCHHCESIYCSAKCRLLDWDDHKRVKCPYGRLSSACKHVITRIGNDIKWRIRASESASERTERGFVWAEFDSYENILGFLARPPQPALFDLQYIEESRLPSLFSSQKKDDDEDKRVEGLTRLIRSYQRHKEFVLVASVRLLGLSPKLVFKFLKIPLRFKKSNQQLDSSNQNLELSKTLILTSLSKNGEKIELDREPDEEERQLFLANILNELQMRGVNLRQAYPKIYEELCLYVEENKSFGPVCLFPRDSNTGGLFMCLIMPKSDPVTYPWLYDT